MLVLACAMPLGAGAAGAHAGSHSDPGPQAQQLRRELANLAEAWGEGGGTFGYPFWDKAAQRYGARELSPSLFREYVSGYRDQLEDGCSLIEEVEVSQGLAAEVAELVRDACSRRVEGLRDQQQLLDELIARAIDTEASPEEVEARDARIAELEADANEAFQDAWRSTRVAMDTAQAALREEQLDPLPEDAFI